MNEIGTIPPEEPKAWEPLSDVWLSIFSSIITAMLVNTISGFRISYLSVPQLLLLLVAIAMIGIYALKKTRALKDLEEDIIENALWGPENLSARITKKKKSYESLQQKINWVMHTCVVCLVLASSFFIVQAVFDKGASDKRDIAFSELSKGIKNINMNISDLIIKSAKPYHFYGIEEAAKRSDENGEK